MVSQNGVSLKMKRTIFTMNEFTLQRNSILLPKNEGTSHNEYLFYSKRSLFTQIPFVNTSHNNGNMLTRLETIKSHSRSTTIIHFYRIYTLLLILSPINGTANYTTANPQFSYEWKKWAQTADMNELNGNIFSELTK